MAVSGDKGQYIIQGMLIGFRSAFQIQSCLIGCPEHFPDICLAKCRVDIGKLVINRLHQSADRFIDPAGDFLGIGFNSISIDIDGRILQTFCQIQLRV